MNAKLLSLAPKLALLAVAALVLGSACNLGAAALLDESGAYDVGPIAVAPHVSIYGFVSVAETGARLEGVVLAAQNQTDVSSEKGVYNLSPLEVVRTEVTASHDSYYAVSKIVVANVNERVDFQLVRKQ